MLTYNEFFILSACYCLNYIQTLIKFSPELELKRDKRIILMLKSKQLREKRIKIKFPLSKRRINFPNSSKNIRSNENTFSGGLYFYLYFLLKTQIFYFFFYIYLFCVLSRNGLTYNISYYTFIYVNNNLRIILFFTF